MQSVSLAIHGARRVGGFAPCIHGIYVQDTIIVYVVGRNGCCFTGSIGKGFVSGLFRHVYLVGSSSLS